jgi:hypothetical protein
MRPARGKNPGSLESEPAGGPGDQCGSVAASIAEIEAGRDVVGGGLEAVAGVADLGCT